MRFVAQDTLHDFPTMRHLGDVLLVETANLRTVDLQRPENAQAELGLDLVLIYRRYLRLVIEGVMSNLPFLVVLRDISVAVLLVIGVVGLDLLQEGRLVLANPKHAS